MGGVARGTPEHAAHPGPHLLRTSSSVHRALHGRHGISLRYLLNRRDAFYPDVGDSSQTRGTLGIFYAYLGHQRFGFVPWE